MRSIAPTVVATLGLSIGACQTLGLSLEAPPPADPPVTPATATTGTLTSSSRAGRLAGMTSEALRSAWGEPALKRTENGAELWQYGGGGCAVLVYFYPAGTTWTVSHAEAVPGGADETAIDACAKAAGKPPLKPTS